MMCRAEWSCLFIDKMPQLDDFDYNRYRAKLDDINPNGYESQAGRYTPGRLQKIATFLTSTVGSGINKMGRGGFEPPTHGFSVRCSTN